MITIRKTVVFTTLLLVYSLGLKAQTAQKLNLPAVMPPSPAIQNFMRYGEIPVDHSTGVPSISIPLYTATSRQLSVPISLSYHASGIKVQDKASTVGLGWVLNCGGYITQTLLGNSGSTKPTYTTASAFRSARPGESSSINVLQDWFSAMYSEFAGRDWTSDRYSFSLPGGESGVFRYTYDTGKIVKLPYSAVKIAPNSIDSVAGGGYQFIITDNKGVSYNFKDDHTKTIATYYISSMVSADKTDTIRFTYKALRNEFYNPNWTSVLQLYCLPSANSLSYSFTPTPSLNSSFAPSYNTEELVPDSIITSTTVITFTTQNDRDDITPYAGKQRITGISVWSRSDSKLIKSVSFVQSYFGAYARKNQRLRLDSVKINGSNSLAVEKYRFVYETSKELPPYPENLADSLSIRFREDYWGYYNGNRASNMVPREFVPSIIPKYPSSSVATVTLDGNYVSSRNPDSLFAKAAMLKEIHYPTGGKTAFDFEPNRAADAYFYDSGWTVPEYVGGFRVRAIKNYLEDGTLANYKYYRYGPGKTRQIRTELFTQVRRDVVAIGPVTDLYLTGITGYPNLIITSSSHVPLTCDNGPPVFYASVAEYVGGMNVNAGKTLYTYSEPPETTNPNLGFELPVYEGPYFRDRGNYVPMLLSKKSYKRLSNGSYIPVSESLSGYTTFLSTSYPMGMKTTQLAEYIDGASSYTYDYPEHTASVNCCNFDYNYRTDGQDGRGPSYYLAVFDVNATQELSLPTQTIERTYDPADSSKYVAKTTDIAYDSFGSYVLGKPVHSEPTQISTTASNNDILITQMSYPADSTSVQPYATMVSRNILTPIIEERSYKTNTDTLLHATKTAYSFWDSGGAPTTSVTNLIYPKLVSSKKGNGNYDPRVEYKGYDVRGNVASVHKYGAPLVSYLWGYNKQRPIAEAKNAKNNNIFHENFEDGTGNSAPNVARTGHYSRTVSYSKSLTGLDAGTYTLSYWKKQGGGEWILKDSTVTVSGSSYTIGISGDYLDDVSLYPADAQMSTSTYDPLIGTTSSTDAKGKTTYYEYDAYQRLKTVRDHNGNVLKMYCYNYAGQQTGCPVDVSGPVNAAVTSGSFVTPNPHDAEWNLEAPPGYTLATASSTTINAAGNSGSNAGRFAYFSTAKTASPETPVNGKITFTAKGSGTIELQLIATWNSSIIARQTFALTSAYKNFTWALPPLYANLEMMVGVIVNGGNSSSQANVQFAENFRLNLQQLNLGADYKRFRADTSTLIGNVETDWYGWSDQYDAVRRKYLQHSAYARMRFKTSAKRIAIEYVRDMYDKIVVNMFPMLETQYNKGFDGSGNIVNGGYNAINVKTKVAAGKTYTISGLKTTNPMYVWFNNSGLPLGAPASPANSGTSLAPLYQLTAPAGAVRLGLLVQRTSDTTNFANPINDNYNVYTECMIEEGAIGATTPQGTIPTAFQLFSGYESSHVSGPAVFINGVLFKYYQVEGNDWAKQLQFVTDTLPAGDKIVEVMMPGQGAYYPYDPHVRRAGTFLRAVYLSNGASTVYPPETKAPGSIVYIHDSIISGPSISTAPQNNVWMMKIKRDPAYGFTGDVFSEGYSGRILSDDIADDTLTTQFAHKLAKFGVDKYWFQVGVNDLGFNQPIKRFYDQYKSLVEKLHVLRPNAKIYIQSTGPAIFEGNNSEFIDDTGLPAGPTANNFRDVQRAIATSHSFTEYVDFEGLFQPNIDNLPDGIHPGDVGNALYADGVRDKSTLLGNTLTPTTFAFYRNSSRPFIKDVQGLYTITATGGKAPYTFAKTSGTLPSGLTFNSDGTITGTPTASGNVTIGVSATDANSTVITTSVSITINPHPDIVVSPGQLLNGQVGVPYSKAFKGNFGYGPYELAVTSGVLPAGLSFNTATGVLSGTPTATGTSTFYVKATDNYGFEGSRPFNLTVGNTTPPVLKDTITFTATVAPNNHLMVTAHRKDNYSVGASMFVATYYTAPGQIELWFGGGNVDIMPGALRSAPVDVGAMALYPGSFSARVDNLITLPATADDVDMVLGSSNLSLSTPYTSPIHHLTATASVNSSGHLIVQAHTAVTFDMDLYLSVGAAINQGSTIDWKGSSFSITAGQNSSAPIDLGALSSLSAGAFTTDVSIIAIFPHGLDGKILSSNSPFTYNLTKP